MFLVKRSVFLLFIWVVIISSVSYQVRAQQTECGSVPTVEQLQHLVQLHGQLGKVNRKSVDTIYIPIKAHVIRRSNGTGGMLPTQIMTEISRVNDVYQPAGVQFYMCDTINFIDDDDVYFFKKGTSESSTADVYDQENVLNIYFAGTLYRTSNGGQDTSYLCGYAYFPPGPDRVFMSNSCSTNGSTLAHEIGHYLGLLHTHDSSNGDELADGTNCSTAGDLFCDTPADPNLSGEVNSSCVYTGTEMDGNGDFYTPDPTNIMSYSRKSCRDNFSAEQISMIYLIAFTERDYLIERLETDFSVSVNGYDAAFSDLSEGTTMVSWDYGDGNTSTNINPVYAYADSGVYQVCINTRNTCVAETYCKLIDITCNTLDASFTYDDPNQTDLVVEFTSQYSDSTTVSWDLGDGTVTTGVQVSHAYSNPGVYSVVMTVENNCGADTTTLLVTVDELVFPIGLDEPEVLNITLYPNPANNVLYLEGGLSEKAVLEIFAVDGSRLIETTTDKKYIDVSSLPAGMWILTITDGGQIYRGKFLKLAH